MILSNNKNTINDDKNIKENKRFALIERVKLVKKFNRDQMVKFIIAGGLVAVSLVLCLTTYTFGYTVKVGDEKLGMVSSAKTAQKAMDDIKEEVFSMTGKNFKLRDELDISLSVAPKKDVVEYDELTERLKSASDMFVPAYTIVVDDKSVLALPSEEMALSTLDEYKESLKPEETDVDAEFANDVSVTYMFAPKDVLCTKESAVDLLAEGEYTYYKAETNESVTDLAEKTGTPEEVIIRENEIEGDAVKQGQVVKLYSGKMFADVVATQRVQREEAIPFETVSKESDEVYKGDKKIETDGEEGVRYIDESVTYTNGVVTKRDVYTDEIIKEPVTQVELLGTKEVPPSVGTGNLTMPTNGNLSSRFGARWGRQHKGIDLSAPEGTPIYAADNGTVTYSQFNDGGYGYLVKIDHGNGTETFYAHCSELLVTKGQVVKKGDLIAKVGNTGRSTGAHLHFEVRQNGTAIDPLPYLNR